ncbi:MAG: glycosyltransferase [Candidatus Moranbacteria bacterium]|nr:glycosyltransferase [Candidatus Moranbacteria bacterium]
MKSSEKFISIIITVFNEEGNVKPLHREIKKAVAEYKLKAEIIFVNDGSSDKTGKNLKELKPIRIISFRRNFGQTAALDAGIKAAKGDILVTMDGDRQNDPMDIKLLLDKMDQGYDVVSGWRKNRKDSFFKKFFSRGANKLRKFLIDDQINDSGCSLKAYKKECFRQVDLYGEMHRFIPALLKIEGYRIGEVGVNHRPRIKGVSKYNWKRLIKGILDLISVWFWKKFANRPLHLFGGWGFILLGMGALILVWQFVERFFFGEPLSNRIWPLVGIFMLIVGFQFIISGLMADISVKTYYQTKNKRAYSIKKIIEN